jgi:hypothetical protein
MQVPVWVKDTAERAGWTFVASFIGAAGYQVGAHFEDINWVASLDVAAVATVFSTLKSTIVAHTPLGDPGTASSVKLTTS